MNDPTAPKDDQPSQAQKTREEIFKRRASRIEGRAEFFKKIQDALAEPDAAPKDNENEIVVEE